MAGCFGATRQLFGFNFTMCLEARGTYRVTGQGVNCQGRLTWRESGRDIFIDVRRQSCGGGQAWEAATIDCRGVNIVRGILDSIFGRTANPFVMVPRNKSPRNHTRKNRPGPERRLMAVVNAYAYGGGERLRRNYVPSFVATMPTTVSLATRPVWRIFTTG